MIITPNMIEQFYCNADVVSAPHGGPVRTEIAHGLSAVAPLMAEHWLTERAVAGYAEQGHEVRHAKSLLRALMTAHGDGDALLFAQVREFLDPGSPL